MTAIVHYGDAWELALTLEPASIDCIVTSPPYWGLRDYGHPGQFGLEPTPEEYVAKLADLFARLRPALKDEGTVWLNLGDSYAGSWGAQSRGGPSLAPKGPSAVQIAAAPKLGANTGSLARTPGRKPKDLLGLPWRVAFALQEQGWYLRSDIIWAKVNPMPESVSDRPTKSHEYVFLLAKSRRYFVDRDGMSEPVQSDRAPSRKAKIAGAGRTGLRQPGKPYDGTKAQRNIRTVWTIASKPYRGAHFATMPPELAERCIRAGTSERGVCPACGHPWVRVVTKETVFEGGSGRAGRSAEEVNASGKWRNGGSVGNANLKLGPTVKSETLGWRATCVCGRDPVPATVLDPFAGSGTTLSVAAALGRSSIGFELNESYRTLIEARLQQAAS